MSLDPWNIFSVNFGTMPMAYTTLATLLDMLLYFFVSLNVAKARNKYKVKAPATEGPEAFQRVFRVQINTHEQLMLHLPLLWIAAFSMSDVFAASLGFIWFIGRILYARGYYIKPKRRLKGFMIAMLMNILLFAGAISSVIASL